MDVVFMTSSSIAVLSQLWPWDLVQTSSQVEAWHSFLFDFRVADLDI